MVHKSTNKCVWKVPGTSDTLCGKLCTYELCKRHRQLLRNGSRLPVLCRSCNKIVTHSEAYLCKLCKSNYIHKKLIAIEKKQKEKKKNLLQELLLKVPRK